MAYKNLTGYTPFKLVYGKEVVVPFKYTTNVASMSTM